MRELPVVEATRLQYRPGAIRESGEGQGRITATPLTHDSYLQQRLNERAP